MFEKLSTKMFHLVNMQSAAVRAGDAKPRIRICLRIGPRLRIQPEVVIPSRQRESQLFDKKLPPKKSRNCSVAETREKMKLKERTWCIRIRFALVFFFCSYTPCYTNFKNWQMRVPNFASGRIHLAFLIRRVAATTKCLT